MILVDDEARDVARMTGVRWYWARVESHGRPRPCIDLAELNWWDRFVVAWCRIGVNCLLGGPHGTGRVDRAVVASVFAGP